MDTIQLKTNELLTYHCGVTMAMRYVADAYCPKEPPYQIWMQYNLRQWSNKCRVKYQESSSGVHEVFRRYKCKNLDQGLLREWNSGGQTGHHLQSK